MSRPRGADRDEQGVTVVLVALLSVVLIGISGFAIDFGQAYASKRNLQKAADAGALAAAQALTQFSGSCAAVRDNPVAFAAAQAAARQYGLANYENTNSRYDSSEIEFDIDCDRTPGVLIVEYGLEGDTTTSTSQILGVDDTITADRRSEAVVDVAPSVGKAVRPLAICSAALSTSARSGDFVKIFYPGNGTASPTQCPIPSRPGNWWTLDCPGERTGSTRDLEAQVRNGCPDRVSVIPGQTNAATPGSLTLVLETACPSASVGSQTCMSGDPGNLDSGGIASAWASLMVAPQQPAIFPVFCVPPQCSESTTSGQGTNAVFPVYKLVSAVVCGYHFSAREKGHSTTGECAGNPYLAGSDPDGSNGNNYMVIKFVKFRSSGSNADSECGLGSECDGGLRRTRLYQ